MCTRETSPERRGAQFSELALRVPPLCEIHLAEPCNDEPELEQPVQLRRLRVRGLIARCRSVLIHLTSAPQPTTISATYHVFSITDRTSSAASGRWRYTTSSTVGIIC